jgi:hypothetical protein
MTQTRLMGMEVHRRGRLDHGLVHPWTWLCIQVEDRFADDDGSLYPHHIVVTDVAMWWWSMYFADILQATLFLCVL